MKLRKYTCAWLIIAAMLISIVSGCTTDSPPTDAQESIDDESQQSSTSAEQDDPQEDVDGPGGMTPFGPEQDPLFNFYSIPADWPRVVPLMSEFQVTIYEWTDNEMYAAGYADVGMSRANNFYTNAQKIHVSSNIWEQDPQTPSVTEGTTQVFNYIGEGNTLSVTLIESGKDSIYFELYFYKAS